MAACRSLQSDPQGRLHGPRNRAVHAGGKAGGHHRGRTPGVPRDHPVRRFELRGLALADGRPQGAARQRTGRLAAPAKLAAHRRFDRSVRGPGSQRRDGLRLAQTAVHHGRAHARGSHPQLHRRSRRGCAARRRPPGERAGGSAAGQPIRRGRDARGSRRRGPRDRQPVHSDHVRRAQRHRRTPAARGAGGALVRLHPPRPRQRAGRAPLRGRRLRLQAGAGGPAAPPLRGMGIARSFRLYPWRRAAGQRISAPPGIRDRQTAIMSHYVVTGGAGFIGSAIVRSLLREGAGTVVVIDNLLTGRESNLEEVRGSVDFQRADIRNYEEIAPLIRGAAVVFHEAAIPSVPRSIDDPVPSHEVNANGTFNVLRAAKEGHTGRVVYAASSSAYGDTEVLPKVEAMTPRPKSPYALQKLMGEYYGNIFSGVYGLETVSLRYFNVYGPRQDPSSAYSGVLSLFMTAVLERQAPTIFGDGEHSRDFTFVEDVADLNLKAARAKGVSGNVYNGGNGGRITLNQAWALLQKLEGVTIAPVYAPPRAGDVRDSQADTTLAVRDLGHAPRYGFEEGMRITLEWYRNHR